MRIVIYNQYFSTPNGAYGTRVYEFARRWVQSGDRVTVVTAVYERSDLRTSGLITRLDIGGIDVRAIRISLSVGHGYAVRALTFLAYSVIATWYALFLPADIVIASSGPITVGIPALVARYARGKPFVFEVRDLWPEGAIQLGILKNRALIGLCRMFERICYSAAARVVALSEGMAGWIEDRYGVRDVAVVPNASDNELAQAVAPKQLSDSMASKFVVLYAGALGFIHNVRQIIDVARAVREARANDVEFVIIGDGCDRALIERQARDHGLSNVHLLGTQPKTEVMAWLHAAGCALSLVRNNPFFDYCSPNKIFDAFAAGAPVIQDTQGWLKRLISENRCGLTVARGDSRAVADAIITLARSPELRRVMSLNARRVASDIMDRGLLARKMRAVLESAARVAAEVAAADGGRARDSISLR